NEVPPCGPGQLTTTPTDLELYGRGYIEVPKNCPGGNCGPGAGAPVGPGGFGPYEQLPPAPINPGAVPMSGGRGAPNGTKLAGTSEPTSAARRDVVGTGVTAQSVSATRTSGPPQSANAQPPSNNGQGSLRPVQPTLIGSHGYDDLR